MKRIVVDMQTGETTILDLSPEEEADLNARKDAAAMAPPPPSVIQRLVDQIAADPIALAALKDALK